MYQYENFSCLEQLSEQLFRHLAIDQAHTITALNQQIFSKVHQHGIEASQSTEDSNFFSYWLDPSLSLHCADFEHGEDNYLYTAQRRNHRNILKNLSTLNVHSILHVDCQWGGFLEDCVYYGFDITALAYHDIHYQFCQSKLTSLKPKVNFLVSQKPITDIQTKHDAIVDIESLNDLPNQQWNQHLDSYAHKIKKGGILFLQVMIGTSSYRIDSIPMKRHYGTAETIFKWAQRNNKTILHIKNIRSNYILTVNSWLKSFEKNKDTLGRQYATTQQWGAFLALMKAELLLQHKNAIQITIQM